MPVIRNYAHAAAVRRRQPAEHSCSRVESVTRRHGARLLNAGLLGAALLASSLPPATAQTAWNVFATIKDSGFFFDSASVKRVGDIVSATLMTDFPKPKALNGVPFNSSTEVVEFDCASKTSRTRELSLYGGHMGEGAIVEKEKRVGAWLSNPPRTPRGLLLTIVCAD
jgi:hypothetical protein